MERIIDVTSNDIGNLCDDPFEFGMLDEMLRSVEESTSKPQAELTLHQFC